MIEYPKELPCFVRENYEIETLNPLIRTEMMTGKAKQRRRYKSTPTFVGATTSIMSNGQAMIFESWWDYVLVSGSQWFRAPIRTPLGMEMRVMRFTEIYEGPILEGNGWRFRCSLELASQAIMHGEWLQSSDFINNMDKFDVLMNSVWPKA